MTISYKKADRVAEKISRRFGKHSWFRGVGVQPDEKEGFVVSVRLGEDAPCINFPERIDGVAVRLIFRGLARAK